jgi:hypothetical protein
MENGSNKKRAGRPKARPQTGPLVLEGSRAREKLEIELGDATADELKEYTRWVELSSSLAPATPSSRRSTTRYASCSAVIACGRRRSAGPSAKVRLQPRLPQPAPYPPPNGTGTPRGGSEPSA